MTDTYFLSKGKHLNPADGRCALEWVSHLAGEAHSDQPQCVSPVLRAFCSAFNDGLPDDKRQKLRPYLARTIGTCGDGRDRQRSWLATDWLIRTYTPAWLALAGLDEPAARLRRLPPMLTALVLSKEMRDLKVALNAAIAASVAAPAFPAAREVWAVAAADVGAAWAAVPLPSGALEVARDAARAARDAAADAAGAGVAALAAGQAALGRTVAELQESTFGLLDRMLPLEPVQTTGWPRTRTSSAPRAPKTTTGRKENPH